MSRILMLIHIRDPIEDSEVRLDPRYINNIDHDY